MGIFDPVARATDLLKEVLPVGDLVNAETVRNHLQLTAERIEQELGEERQLNRFEGSEQEWERQPLPDGPITVGIDGGYVRAAHKQGWFEVIAGKSVVAFRRDEEGEVPSAKRLTVLQQQTKALQEERSETGADLSKQLESVKHLLWHGNTEEALERLGDLLVELSLMQARSNAAKKVADGLSEFETYVCNNREFIPNFGERRRQGETISTAFVESTINQVVSRQFVKKQQMQWTLRGAHLLLQTRTRVLNEDLDDLFRRWYPKFRSQPQTQETDRKAA